MHPLTEGSLPEIAGAEDGPRVEVPGYDRSAVTVGIVHFGVGGFHRAHQAAILDDLMNEGLAHDWAICGVGVLPGDARMRDALRETLAFRAARQNKIQKFFTRNCTRFPRVQSLRCAPEASGAQRLQYMGKSNMPCSALAL